MEASGLRIVKSMKFLKTKKIVKHLDVVDFLAVIRAQAIHAKILLSEYFSLTD